MGDKTGISWTQGEDGTKGATWNPIRAAELTAKGMVAWGCMKVTDGCQNCYASTMHANHGGQPYQQENPADYAALRDSLQLHEPTLTQPQRWTRGRKIFVCSMTDLFGEWVPDEWLYRIFEVMARTPEHTYQVLTKRAHRMRDFLLEYEKVSRVLPNVWAGVTVENQSTAFRLNYLLDTPAAVRWVSAEPLIGPLEIRNYLWGGKGNRLHWVVIGGESGPGFRPMNLEWARNLRDACTDRGVAVWYKQGASLRPGQNTELDGQHYHQFPKVAA